MLDYRIRKCIQIDTKKLKMKQGKCSDCGEQNELQAAHPMDNSRKGIITKVLLEKHVVNGKVVIDNLKKLEDDIMEAHKPYDKFFRFLCQECHQKEHHV